MRQVRYWQKYGKRHKEARRFAKIVVRAGKEQIKEARDAASLWPHDNREEPF